MSEYNNLDMIYEDDSPLDIAEYLQMSPEELDRMAEEELHKAKAHSKKKKLIECDIKFII